MRALETGRYLLRDTNTGITAIVNNQGGVVKSLPRATRGVLTGTVVPYAGGTPYQYTGNRLVVIVCLLLLFSAGLGRKWKFGNSQYE